jgi:hypothetical protein
VGAVPPPLVARLPPHRYLPKATIGDSAMTDARISDSTTPRPSLKSAEPLRLVAFDEEDLAILSAQLQDAILRVGDLAYVPERSRFALVARRFDWGCCEDDPRRCLSGLRFDRVLRARTRNIDLARTEGMLSLLAIRFAETVAPSGTVTLIFAGGAEIELELECIEARLQDLGPAWSAKSRPAHDLGND